MSNPFVDPRTCPHCKHCELRQSLPGFFFGVCGLTRLRIAPNETCEKFQPKDLTMNDTDKLLVGHFAERFFHRLSEHYRTEPRTFETEAYALDRIVYQTKQDILQLLHNLNIKVPND